MKSIALFTILMIMFFSIITYLARPDIVEKKYQEIRAPISKYFSDKDALIWMDVKATEHAAWMIKLQLPKDCQNSKTALREIECKNLIKQHAQSFEQNWINRVRNGWKPKDLSN